MKLFIKNIYIYILLLLNKHNILRRFFLGFFVVMLLINNKTNATTYYSIATGNWTANTTWSLSSGGSAVGVGVYPVAGDIVTIERAYIITVDVNAECASINFTNIVSASSTLTISGNNSLAVSGLITMIRPAAGFVHTINVNAGTLTAGSLTMSATITTRNDIINISTGTVIINGATTTGTTGCQFIFSGAGTLEFKGTFTSTPTITTFTGSTVKYTNAGAQTVRGTTYSNLLLGGSGIKTTTGVTVNGILSLEETATASAAPTYGAAATLQYNTSTPRTAGAEWLATFAATGGVIIANTGTITMNAAKVFNANIPLTINNGASLSMSTFLLTLNGNLINNGGTASGTTGGVTIAGTATQSIGAFTTTGTVSMTKTALIATLTGNINAAALTINGAGGTLNLGVSLSHTLTGVVTLTAGSLNGGSSTLNVNITSATAWGGTGSLFTAGSSTVVFGGAAQTLSAATTTFNNLTLSGSGTKTLSSATIINGGLTVNSGITLSMGAFLLTVNGDLINSGGTVSGTTGGVTIGGTATQSIGAFTTTGTVTMSKTGGAATLTGNMSGAALTIAGIGGTLDLGSGLTHTLTGVVTLTNGTLNGGSSILNVNITSATAWGGTGSNFVANSSTVVFGGVAQTISASTTTFNNITLGGSGTKTLSSATIANGTVTVNSGVTLSMGTFLLTLNGDLINSGGTVSGTTGGVTIAGTATQNIGAFTTTGTVSITKTAGTATLTGNMSGAALTINGSGGTLNLGSGLSHTLSGVVTLTAGSLDGGSSTLNVNITSATAWGGTGSIFVPNIGTVIFGGVAQTLSSSATTFNNLTLGGSGTKTFNSVNTINGNLTINSGVSVNLNTGLTHAANSLILAGVTQSSGSWGGTGSGATNINSTYFTATTGIVNITASCATGSWLGLTNTDWHTASNWCDGVVPTSTTNIIINSGGNQPNIGATAVCNNITMNAGSTLTITGTNTLTVSGNWTNSGTFTANSSTVIFDGATQTLGTGTYNNITLIGSGVKTTTGVTVNGIFSVEETATVSAAPTYGAAATLQYNTTTSRTAGSEWITPFVATGGVIISSTGTITMNAAKVFNASAPLTINSGATLSMSTFLLTLNGNLINNGGTASGTTGGVTIAGTAAQSIGAFTTTGTVSMTKTALTATLTGNVNGAGLTINGVGGTINLGAGLTHTFTGAWTRTAGTLNGGSSILKIAGNVSGVGGTFTASTSTVEWNAAGVQTVGGLTYNNLTLSGSGAKTTTGVTVNGVFSLEGTATASAVPTYGAAASLQYNTSTPRTAAAEWLTPFAATGGVIIANTGTITMNAAKVFNANIPLTINNGASLSMSTFLLTLNGNLINNGGTASGTTGGVTIAGTATQSIGAFTTTGTVSMTKTALIATLTGNINAAALTINGAGGTLNLGVSLSHTLTGVVTLTAGSLNGGSSTLNINVTSASAWGGTGSLFTAGTSTVVFGGVAQTLSASPTTFNNITFSGTGTKTLSSATTVNGNTTVNSGITLSMGSFLLTLYGDLINSGGTISGTTGGVTIAGTSPQSIGAFTSTGTVTMTKTLGTATLTGNFNAAALTINGLGGNLDLGSGLTHTLTGIVTLTAGSLIGGSSTLNVNITSASAWGGTGSNFIPGTSTVIFGGAAQTLSASTTTFYNLTFGGSSTKTLSNVTTVNGIFAINTSINAILSTGLTHIIHNLYLGGVEQSAGTWGGTGSGATNINSTYFTATTGILNVSYPCPGGTWSGWIDSDWHIAENWCDGVVPTAGTNVVINSTLNQPLVDADAFCNNITINTGATITVSGSIAFTVNGNWTNNGTFISSTSNVIFNGSNCQYGGSATTTFYDVEIPVNCNLTIPTAKTLNATNFIIRSMSMSNSGNLVVQGTGATSISGNAICERYLSYPGNYWHYVSSPCAAAGQAYNFDAFYLKEYLPVTSTWNSLIATSNMTAGKGYTAKKTTAVASTVSFKGAFNNGDGICPFEGTVDKWNIVGNPYPSTIDIDAAGWGTTWTADIVDRTMYFVNGAGYIVWKQAFGGTRPDGLIAPGEAGFVEAISGSWTPTNAVRVTNTTTMYKKGEKSNSSSSNLLRVFATDSTYSDQIIINFNKEALNEYDTQWDSYKFFGSAKIPQISSYPINDNTSQLVINSLDSLSLIEGVTVPVDFTCNRAGKFILSSGNTESFDTLISITLEDKVANKLINFRSNTYSFTTTVASKNDNRFFIHFKPNVLTITENLLSNQINLVANNNTIYISSNDDSNLYGTLEIFDITGRIVNNYKLTEQTFYQINISNLPSSSYIIRYTDNNTSLTKKIIK